MSPVKSTDGAPSANGMHVGVLQEAVAGLRRDIVRLEATMTRFETTQTAMNKVLSERRGGIRMLAAMMTVSATLGGGLATAVHWVKGG